MDNHQIKLKVKDFRAIKSAEIILDGITVVSGENGSGKSTLSKLLYHIFKTSIDFDVIVNENTIKSLREIYGIIDVFSHENPIILKKENSQLIREIVRKIYNPNLKINLIEIELIILEAIDILIDNFKEYSLEIKNDDRLKIRTHRLKSILGNYLKNNKYLDEIDLHLQLTELKVKVQEIIKNAFNLKETRPLDVFYSVFFDEFNQEFISKSFRIEEYGVDLIDKSSKKLIPVNTIQNIVYIDTPMIVGVSSNGITHWNDLNKIFKRKEQFNKHKNFSAFYNKEILKGQIYFSEDDYDFIYEREDGAKFNLLECATGLKSFAIIQMLYKNGFLTDKTLLIIDEPEAHLHPQWIVEYARLLVLLNKKIGVKFFIASHHPDMISAIKYISKKEKIEQNLHFYLSEKNKKNSYLYDYKHLGVEIEKIFSSFNIAFERIDLYGKTE